MKNRRFVQRVNMGLRMSARGHSRQGRLWIMLASGLALGLFGGWSALFREASVAAPPQSANRPAGQRRRLFDAFSPSKKPPEPQEFIAAPLPPTVAAIQQLEKQDAAGGPLRMARAAQAYKGPATPAPKASHRVPTWTEAVAFASSLQSSARAIASAATNPAYQPPRESLPATAKMAVVVDRKGGAAEQPAGGREAATGARPPSTQRFERLRTRLSQTLAAYRRRPLNSAQHTPWEIMHGFIAFGIPSQIRVGGPSGDLVNSIGWMNMGGRCKGQVMLATTDDRLMAMRGVGLQGHAGQYLAILAQCRVALKSPISIQGKTFTVADLVEEEKASCKAGTELTFALIALAHYLPSDAEWTSRDGKAWSLEKLVAEEIEQPIRGAPCGGTHRLFGLAYGCQRRLKATGRLEGHYARADHFVRDYQRFTLTKLQNSDGSFSTEWFKYPADREDDIDRKVQTTGHILEWLVGSLDQDQLYQPRVTAAVEFLSSALLREPAREWKLGPLGHALHALTIYQERAWGVVLPGGIAAFQGPMKAAPATARMADVSTGSALMAPR